MGRPFSGQLYDPFTQVCFHNPVSLFFQKAVEADFFADHRFGFNDVFGLFCLEYFLYSQKCIRGSRGFINMGSSFLGFCFEPLDEFGKALDVILPDGLGFRFYLVPGNVFGDSVKFLEVLGRSPI